MPDVSKPYFSCAPFKDWGTANYIHRLRDSITANQEREYDEQICNWLATRCERGLPFPDDFTSEPDQIIQIKRFQNDLYHVEELFRTMESSHTLSSILTIKELTKLAYETTNSLLTTCSQIEATFRPEITELLSCLSKAQAELSKHSILPSQGSIALNTGLAVGRTIDQMNPADITGDSDLWTYFGSIFPQFPTHIETVKGVIEKFSAANPAYVPSINQAKMGKLLEQGLKLSETIKNSNQNILLLIGNLFSLFRQITSLWGEISKEALDLSDTAQGLAREIMAMCKYVILPNLFAAVDKLEVQMMMKPGRLSKPLMEKAKQWYGSLTEYAKIIVKFDKKGEKLLKLEDSRFIELRLAPRRQEIETWTRTLHLINQAQPTLNALKSLVDELVDRRNPSAEEHADYIRLKETLRKHFQHLEPHLKQACEKFKPMFEEQLAPARSISAFVTDVWRGTPKYPPITNLQPTMKAFMSHLKQLKTDHEFRIHRNESLITSVMEKANIVLFPYNEQGNILDIQEEPTFLNLGSQDAWGLHRKCGNERAALTNAEENCAELMVKLERHQETDGTIKFHPGYTPCLLEDNIPPQPGKFHVKMEGSELKYAVLLKPIDDTEPVRLYIQSLEDAVKAERKGYVWNKDTGALSYIAPDGQIQRSVRLTDTERLKLFVAWNKSKLDSGNGLVLTEGNIDRLITSCGGHYPGSLRTGTIPCSEVGCTLAQVTSIEQLKPYLPRLFDEALEQGHIRDEVREQCIKLYSNIQPYLIAAFKNVKEKDIRAFDKNVVELFSGNFYGEMSRSSLSLTDFRLKLPSLQRILATEKERLIRKHNDSFATVRNTPISVETALSAEIRHYEFTPDIAEFMYSMEPIKRQIHDSNKTLFKIRLALQHLHDYCATEHNYEDQLRHPEKNRENVHFPWFQTWLYQLKKPIGPSIYEQLDAHLLQIEGYEEDQIWKNERLIVSVTEKNTRAMMPLPERIKPYDLSEISAFKNLYPINEASLMIVGKVPEANQLFIKILAGELHYTFFRYGKIQTGHVPLTPHFAHALETLDEDTVVSQETLFDMLDHIYGVLEQQVVDQVTELSPDEALDLYQWYRTKDHEMVQANASFYTWIRVMNQYIKESDPDEKSRLKSRAEQSRLLIQPYLNEAWRNDPAKIKRISTFDNACEYFKKNSRIDSRLIHEFFEAQTQTLKLKLTKYEEAAKKMPAYKTDTRTLNPTHEVQQVDRKHHLIKHTRSSARLSLLKAEMNGLYKNLNAVFKEKLEEASSGIPYPDIYDFNSITPYFIAGATALNWSPILMAQQVVPFLHERYSWSKWLSVPESRQKKTNIPDQVMVYMRLKNAVYFIEQIILHLEKINDQEGQIPYVFHLIVAYLYFQDFTPMIKGLLDDPHLAVIYNSMASKLKSILNTLRDEGQYYSGDEALNVNKDHSLLSFMKFIKVFPEHISSTVSAFHKKYLDLAKSAEIAAAKIETIIEHASHSHLRLFFNLPMVGRLVRELNNDLSQLLKQTPDAVRKNLGKINTQINKFVLEADVLEARLGLQPGTVSKPMKQIMEQFYKGLITPLVPLVDERVQLLCNTDLIDQRIAAAKVRESIARRDSSTHWSASFSMSGLQLLGSDSTETGRNNLNDYYKTAIPALKKALNGSDLYTMSFDAAINAGHRDCFIWNKKQKQLFYIDAEGMPNAQTGCSLALMSFPDGVDLPKVLEHKLTIPQPVKSSGYGLLWMPQEKLGKIDLNELMKKLKNEPRSQYICTSDGLIYHDKIEGTVTSLALTEEYIKKFNDYFPAYKKIDRLPSDALKFITSISGHTQPDYMIKVAKPTLIQQGDQYFIYINADKKGDEGTYVVLDADILSSMNLDFTKTKHLAIHDKYQAMYDEIALKAKLTYPVHLQNTYKFIDFMKRNGVVEGKKGPTPDYLYLSEREIQQLITSNSDLTLQKNGVSLLNERRSCLISMPSIPGNFDELTLPPDYDSCYVRVDGNQCALYLIDIKEKTITEKRVYEGKEGLFSRLMSTIDKNKLLIRDDFKKIELFTGHVEEPHVLGNVDTFVATAENMQTLQAQVKLVKVHYEGLLATSDLNIKTAEIQLNALQEEKDNQASSNKDLKEALFREHFSMRVEGLCKQKVKLHEYTLCFLKDETKTKPKQNHLDVWIKGAQLHYKVIDATGKVQGSSFKLSMIYNPAKGPIVADNLQQYLSDILKITASKGDGRTFSHSLATEYREHLRAKLENNSGDIITGALDASTGSIDDALTGIKTSFDKEHLKLYQQLGKIDKAVDDMRRYLNHTTSLWSTQQSLFESAATINRKKQILASISDLAANQNMPVETRIEAIKSVLVGQGMLVILLDYQQYDTNCFASLLQTVLRLFEAVGLYTPTVVQRADKLLRAIEEPTIQPQPFRFFAGSTRENVKSRIATLKTVDGTPPRMC